MGRQSEFFFLKNTFQRILKIIHPDLHLSREFIRLIDDILSEIMQKIAIAAVCLQRKNNKKKLGNLEIESAVKLLLPYYLGKMAASEAYRAVIKYEKSFYEY